jgi:magnesium chelatase accessory protein
MADGRPTWSIDGHDWPNRDYSRFLPSSGMNWHVQELGEGPAMLLLHGTGASSHSFRDVAPALADDFHVLVPDLPGHGFTDMPPGRGLSLPGMAALVGAMLRNADFEPEIAVGHSAGAAVLVEMALRGMIRPRVIIALNGALRPMRGTAVFSPLAKLLFLNQLAPRLFARRAAADGNATRRLLEGTGSVIDGRGLGLYQRLFGRPGHVAATLGMMAHWDLQRLPRDIGRLESRLVLVTALRDRAIPPDDALWIASRLPSARVVPLDYGGHLVHEEEPGAIATLIAGAAAPDLSVRRRAGKRSGETRHRAAATPC